MSQPTAGRRAHRSGGAPQSPATVSELAQTPTSVGLAAPSPFDIPDTAGVPPPLSTPATSENPIPFPTTGGAGVGTSSVSGSIGRQQPSSTTPTTAGANMFFTESFVDVLGGAALPPSGGATSDGPPTTSPATGGDPSSSSSHQPTSSGTAAPPSWMLFGAGTAAAPAAGAAAGGGTTSAAAAGGTTHPAATTTTTTTIRKVAAAAMVDAAVETAPFLTIDDEISIASREIRELDNKIFESSDRAAQLQSKLLIQEDEQRIRELAAQRNVDAATIDLERVRTSGVDYMDRKVQDLESDRLAEARRMYDETKGFADQRKAREKQRLQDDLQRLTADVDGLREKRDLAQAANDGVNETAVARAVRKAKTVPQKIAVAADMATTMAQQLKTYLATNVEDIVRVETGAAFVDIRRQTMERRQGERSKRSAALSAFSAEAVKRSEELMKARDHARKGRQDEHQKLLQEARLRSASSTNQATQTLLDQVKNTHEEAMRKFEMEFEGQHQHLKQMHHSIVRDDHQLDESKVRETRQRFESHRKMAKELLEADAQSLVQAKQREAQFFAETQAGGGGAITTSVSTAVARGSAEVQRRVSSLCSTVHGEIATLERDASLRQNTNGNRGGNGDAENIEERAVAGELKKMLSAVTARRVEQQKALELCIRNFTECVENCSNITQVQRSEVRAISSQALMAQKQWDAELRRMMSDFSIVAATSTTTGGGGGRRGGGGGREENNQNNTSSSSPQSNNTTPVGFLLSTLNDSVESLAAQVSQVRNRVVAPVASQRRLLGSAIKEDSERTSAHQAINAKVMKIFQMFETADATMDSIRQREDEVRVEEISLQTQQRQLAEERRAFAVKCTNLRRSLEQTERETLAAQNRERDARQELAESERQLASLAIEQRTLVARASTESGLGLATTRATTYVDPMVGHHQHQRQQQQSSAANNNSNAYYSNKKSSRTHPMREHPENSPAGGGGGATTATTTSGGDESSDEKLRKLKNAFVQRSSSSASPGGIQADVSQSSASDSAISIYGLPVRGVGMSSMAAAVSPPASQPTSSGRR